MAGGAGWRHSIRKLWSAQATSIARSEKPSLVLRKTSLTIRQRLTPAMVFSTNTRALEIVLFSHWSPALNSLPFGFFSAGKSGHLWDHSLENRYLCPKLRLAGKQSRSHRRSFCHVSCPFPLD